MTTHYVQIRLKKAGPSAPWESLTDAPISLKDAQGLQLSIGPSWESRVVNAPSSDALLNLPLLVERLNLLTHVDGDLIEKCKDVPPGIMLYESEVLSAMRNALFGVLEAYRGKDVLVRWRTEDHDVVHAKSCKGGAVKTHTKTLIALTGKHVELYAEMEIRAQHVTVQTIPGLGISATLRILQPKLHHVECSTCGKASTAVSAVAEIVWGAHTMRREYEV